MRPLAEADREDALARRSSMFTWRRPEWRLTSAYFGLSTEPKWPLSPGDDALFFLTQLARDRCSSPTATFF